MIDIVNHQRFQTPAELYKSAVKLLETSKQEEDIKTFIAKARFSILRFYTIAPQLPELHSLDEDAMAGFRNIMEWYFKAKDFIENLPYRMDSKIINRMIELLKELKALSLSDIFSDGVIREKIQKKAKRDIKNYRKLINEKGGKRELGSSQMNELLGLTSNEQYSDHFFLTSAEKIYRTLDKTYAESLDQLQNNIYQITSKINEFDSTPTGRLLDQYDKLAGMLIQERFNRIGILYSINKIVEWELSGQKIQNEPLIDSVIETLKEIKQHGKKETKKADKIVVR